LAKAAANVAVADDTEGLTIDFFAHQFFLQPVFLFHAGITAGDFANERQHQTECQFGDSDGGGSGSIHDGDAVFFGSLEIDVIHTNTSATNGFKVPGGFENFLGDLGPAADDHGVVFPDDLK